MEKKIISIANYNTITELCKDALVNHKMICITGAAGLGKTTAIGNFIKKNPHNVYLVTVSPSMTAKIFYSSILNSYGDSDYRTTEQLYFIIQKAINQFNNNNENKLLIIDEAGKLKTKMYEYLHEFRDKTKDTTGIILAGVDYFQKNLETWKNSGKVGIPEFCSRIYSWQGLSEPTKIEIISIIKAYGINDEEFIKDRLDYKDFRSLTNDIEDYLTIQKN